MNKHYYWDRKIYPKKQTIYDFAAIKFSTKQYFIQKFLSPKKTDIFLSLGCGIGRNLLYLSPQIKKGIGIDISFRAINTAQKAKKKLGIQNINFFCQDATEINFKADKIICFDLLEHLKKPQKIFKVINKNLKKNGKALIYTNFYGKFSLDFLKEFLLRNGKLKRLWFVDYPPHHLHRFQKKQIDNYCQKSKLKYKFVFKNHFFTPLLNFLVGLLRILVKRKQKKNQKTQKKIIIKVKPSIFNKIQYFFARFDLLLFSFLPSSGVFIYLEKK
jgi:2-polyprenyl-3-methyl-5-hydroxy-6-metoxy-1,4-benzoquinol methylase